MSPALISSPGYFTSCPSDLCEPYRVSSRIPNRTPLVHMATLSKHGKDPERAKRSICPQEARSWAVHADPCCAEDTAGLASLCVSPGSSHGSEGYSQGLQKAETLIFIMISALQWEDSLSPLTSI